MPFHQRLLWVLVLSSAVAAPRAHAWGAKGHEMQARAAVANLPADVPAFFRSASTELAQLIREPDRWRTAEQPALDETTGVNHTFKWEIAPRPLPANRHFFIIKPAKAGKLQATREALREFGAAPYAIQEWGEMLTGAFRRWREMPSDSPEEKQRREIHERSILFIAGVLGHWVTDVSQPMHASIHGAGWHASAPNPNGYAGKGLHARYENTYVTAAISQKDVDALLTSPPRLLDEWVREAGDYIAESNSHVEQIYRWDLAAAFGSGNEPGEAKPFTAERLAFGARMLRDVWHTAWTRSGLPRDLKKTLRLE